MQPPILLRHWDSGTATLPATNAGLLKSIEAIHHPQPTYPMKMISKTCLIICCFCSFARGHAQEVFSHTTTPSSILGNYTKIDMDQADYHLSLLDEYNWTLIIKPNPGQKAANPHPVGAWIDRGRKQGWCIYNEDGAPMPLGVTFTYWFERVGANFIVVKPTADKKYIIEHPLANNNPAAKIYATHRYPTIVENGTQDFYYNRAELLPVYNPSISKWELTNQGGSPLALGAYYVHISPNTNSNGINNAVNNTVINNTVVNTTTGSANVATSTGYSDPTLNTYLRAQNKQAILKYLGALGLEQRIKIQNQSALLMNSLYRRLNPGSRNDADADGHPSSAIGGDDCDDFNPLIYPSDNEVCAKDSVIYVDGALVVWMPSLVDEDCNAATIVSKQYEPTNAQFPSEGDRDGDGIYSCECYNYGKGRPPAIDYFRDPIQAQWKAVILVPLNKESAGADYLTHGIDCDDTNPAIVKNSQKCVGENKVATCVSGKWELKDCRKCVTQPNGTGLVVEW
jgi:hypothetical protein